MQNTVQFTGPVHQRLWELTHRRPFTPFRVLLSDGSLIEVTSRGTCAVLPTQFVMEGEGGGTRWIRYGDVAQVAEITAC